MTSCSSSVTNFIGHTLLCMTDMWCAWGDLNSHALRHWNLNPARLPIPPQALQGVILQWLADSSKYQPALGSRTQPHTARVQFTHATAHGPHPAHAHNYTRLTAHNLTRPLRRHPRHQTSPLNKITPLR